MLGKLSQKELALAVSQEDSKVLEQVRFVRALNKVEGILDAIIEHMEDTYGN